MATRYEYREEDVHNLKEKGTWVEQLNRLGAQGWRVIWIDRDTSQHVIAVLEREIEDKL